MVLSRPWPGLAYFSNSGLKQQASYANYLNPTNSSMSPSSSYRDVAMYYQEFFTGHIELAIEFIWLPVDNSKTFVVLVKNRLQKL